MSTAVPMYGFGGGGGAPLNFKVVPNPQPDTAKENTIWVDTDRINNYYFSATQPENMVNYDVWFPVGTSSTVEFNALKKNGIQVYPISAKQYVSGVLRDVVAKSYQGGGWVEWWNGITYYSAGNEYIPYTGGWEVYKTSKGSITKTESGIVADMKTTASQNTTGYVYTKNKIDVSKKNKITVNSGWRTSIGGSASEAFIALINGSTDRVDNNAVAIAKNADALDVSTVSGEYCVAVGCMLWGLDNVSVKFDIKEIGIE